MEFRIDKILRTLSDDLNEICIGLHDTYGRRLWKYCLESLVFEYIDMTIRTCSQNEEIPPASVKEKCSAEIQKIVKNFANKVPERSLDKDSPLVSFGKIFYMEVLDMEALLRKLSSIKTLIKKDHKEFCNNLCRFVFQMRPDFNSISNGAGTITSSEK